MRTLLVLCCLALATSALLEQLTPFFSESPTMTTTTAPGDDDDDAPIEFEENCNVILDTHSRLNCERLQTVTKDAQSVIIQRNQLCKQFEAMKAKSPNKTIAELLTLLNQTHSAILPQSLRNLPGHLNKPRLHVNSNIGFADAEKVATKMETVMNKMRAKNPNLFNPGQILTRFCDLRKRRMQRRRNRKNKGKKFASILKSSRKNKAKKGTKRVKRALLSQPRQLQECMTMACVCKFLNGSSAVPCTYKGVLVQKAVRKEYHTLTLAERTRFHRALLQIYNNGAWQEIGVFHLSGSQSGSAHNGPAFYPWHRELLKRIELELRRVDPTVSMPYWYSEMSNYFIAGYDGTLTKQMVTFSKDFMGSSTGTVEDGAPAFFINIIRRAYLSRNAGSLWTYYDQTWIQQLLNEPRWDRFFNVPQRPKNQQCGMPKIEYPDGYFENHHGAGHNNIGGDMMYVATAGSDPMFYLHHAYVDSLWEAWRLKFQTREERETQYPSDENVTSCTTKFHLKEAVLEPFGNMLVGDALSNSYTDELYEYAPWPSCTFQNPDCGSENLFCDLTGRYYANPPRCMVKLQIGARCIGFKNNEEPCLNGRCINEICVANR